MKRIVWRGLPFRNKFYKNIGNEQSTPIKNIDLFSVNIFKVKSCEKVKSKMFWPSPILEQKKVFFSSAFPRLLNVRQILDGHWIFCCFHNDDKNFKQTLINIQ